MRVRFLSLGAVILLAFFLAVGCSNEETNPVGPGSVVESLDGTEEELARAEAADLVQAASFGWLWRGYSESASMSPDESIIRQWKADGSQATFTIVEMPFSFLISPGFDIKIVWSWSLNGPWQTVNEASVEYYAQTYPLYLRSGYYRFIIRAGEGDFWRPSWTQKGRVLLKLY